MTNNKPRSGALHPGCGGGVGTRVPTERAHLDKFYVLKNYEGVTKVEADQPLVRAALDRMTEAQYDRYLRAETVEFNPITGEIRFSDRLH